MPNIPTLLLVDDEPELLEMLQNILEPKGYRCLSAGSGRLALEILEQETIDLVLTDIHMPGMSGLQLLEEVTERWPNTAGMVLTGHADKDSAVDAINLGHVQAYLEKPVQSAHLLREVGDVVRGKRLREEEIRQTEERIKLVEAQRQRTLELFYAITNTAHDAILMVDGEGKITYWNRQAEIMFGYPMIEAVGKELHSFFAPGRDKTNIFQGLERFTQTGQWPISNNVKEFNALRRDGTVFPVELSLSAANSGENWFTLGFVRDITERKQAEDELRRYENIVSTSTDFLSFIDRDYIYRAVNEAYLKFFDKNRDEIIGCHVNDILGKEVFQNIIKPDLDRCLSGHYVNYERWFDSTMCGRIFLDVRYAPFIDEHGTVSGITVSARDITDKKKIDDELRKSRERLRNLSVRLQAAREEERSVIARDIHDQLGQTLTGLKMDLSWFADRLPKNWKRLPARTRTMIELVDSTIDFVRKLSSDLRPSILDDLGLETAIDWQLQEFAAHSGCHTSLVLGNQELGLDRERNTAIFRIVQETLTNVARHAKATHVDVALGIANAQLILTVKDNGIGITEDKIVSSDSIGLIGMQERAGSFGGQVTIEKRKKGGTLVTLTMPLATVPA